MYSEIKYDGERVQLHKSGDEFQYYSRSLKPVLPHKVSHSDNTLLYVTLTADTKYTYFMLHSLLTLNTLTLCCLTAGMCLKIIFF